MTREQMASDHAGLVQACAWLMSGKWPDFATMNISEEAQKQIKGIVSRLCSNRQPEPPTP